MKTLMLTALLTLPAFALGADDLDVALNHRFRQFSALERDASAQDLGEEWFLFRRMLRLSVAGQVSVGIAKVELAPEVEVIYER